MRGLFLMIMALCAAPAAAQEFRSPSGNISCYYYGPERSAPNYALRCDITNHQPSWTEPPADCDLDWDGILFLEETGPGRRGCAGDIGASPRAPVLDYGRQISAGGITCRSERTGVTCTNRDGHGIFLSRRQQRIF